MKLLLHQSAPPVKNPKRPLSATLTIRFFMKLALVYSTVFCFAIQSAMASPGKGKSTNEVKLTLELNNESLKTAFKKIEKKTEFLFAYQSKLVDAYKKLTIIKEERTLTETLELLLKNTNLAYRQVNSSIIIYKNNTLGASILETTKASINLLAAAEPILGKVTNDKGEAVGKATVTVKGTNRSVVTNDNGTFTIEAAKGDVLVITYVGFQPIELVVGDSSNIDVQLLPIINSLGDVVVIGYGSQKKVNVTGSVVSVNSKKLVESNVANLTQAISGLLPGVIVNTSGGGAGDDGAQILIRGKGTLGSNAPLVVIDGVPDRGGFARLSPQDIESFTVLKDASAAIYGARAANGVILVTTKRGTAGKPVFNASTSILFSQPTTKRNQLDSWQAATLDNEYLKVNGENPRWTDDQVELLKNQTKPLEYPNTDWNKLLIKDWSKLSNTTLSVNGGSKDMRYFLSGQYLKQEGVFKGNDYPYIQSSIRANFDANLTKTLTMGLDILYRRENRNYSQIGDGIWGFVLQSRRYLVDYFPDGRVGRGIQAGEYNAAETLSPNAGFTRINDNFLNTKISFRWELPVKGMALSAYGAFDPRSRDFTRFKNTWEEWSYSYDSDTYSKAVDNTPRTLEETKGESFTKTFNVKLDYQKSLGNHNFDAFVAYEQRRDESSFLSGFRTGLPTNQIVGLFAGLEKGQGNNGFNDASGRVNYFGRMNYDYNGKYLATFSLRHDGSQNFPPGKRFGTFPAISVGWKISDESFMRNISAINNLKLRASWGKMGNDNVGPFQYLSTYAYSISDPEGYGFLAGYDFGNGLQPGIYESTAANPNITWETATTSNIGLEASLFNRNVTIELDYFKSRRNGILIARNASVPEYTGLQLPAENLGIVDNSGYEIQISHQKKLNKNFSYNVGGNMSYARNKVVFYDEPASVTGEQKYEGRPIDSYTVYEDGGIFQTKDEADAYPQPDGQETAAGDVKIIDLNGDGKIDFYDTKRINYGRIPEIVYAFNLGASYKNFDLSILLQGQANSYVNIGNPLGDDKLFFENRWTNGNSTYPRANPTAGAAGNSTFGLRKADFLRFKNVSLTYNVPEKLLTRVKLSRLQFYARGNNLFLLSDNIEGNWRDPESDFNNFPMQRTVQFGLNINF
jgi:TonB-dependent starch-binding outer membrane protein SusC